MTAPKGFGLYRLCYGTYAGWRLRDVWRYDPNALLRAAHAPTTGRRDGAAINLFLVLLGGIAYCPPEQRERFAATTTPDDAPHETDADALFANAYAEARAEANTAAHA